MKEVNGYSLPFDFSKLKKKADLIEMDGPLLSLYQNKQGDCFLFYWLDADASCNRWMIVRIQPNSLLQYLHHSATLRQVIFEAPDSFVWIADMTRNGEWTHVQCVAINDVPEDYLPGEESFFEFEHKEEIEQQITTDIYELTVPACDSSFFDG
jgi:hypothetical protein